MRTTSLLSALALALALAPATLGAQDAAATADGARVWANNCTRCHNARPSQERTDAQWQTIVLHMRARANLTRADARLV
ncbi:MAG: cytochrome c, partial [Gemmatimonadetes bacterium]|nr:cytochrome c [Gemmatimonadota bacterium]NIQ55661.1 cytochrome c [Gemmatimonadota bacterium]NIU75864.1 cytochrome c [Gammaproteobacteria bacterium]NIX45496.1 cytochrome c [Gemmatimonadota bacterium]NIY09778.1 cytochrome c [Gemmatimonadota bacterium]